MSDRKNNEPEQTPASDHVGYRKPPTERRFKQSGNMKGRPKGSKNRKTIVREVALEAHNIVENGRRRRLTTIELVLLCLRNMALKDKNARAFEEFHRLIKAYQPQAANENAGYLVVPAPITPEEAIAEGKKANAEARARRMAQSQGQ